MTAPKTPCYKCPDRYTACSDHCQKPDYLAWREKKRRIREARKAEGETAAYTLKQIRRNRRSR